MPGEKRALHQLTSWKEIAEHLHVAVRTAQSWEREKGLPVLRMPGKKGRVVADPVELDHWRQSVFRINHRFSNPRYYKIFAALLSVLLTMVAAHELIHYLSTSRDHSPATTRIERQPLVVVDHSKSELSQKTISKTDRLNAGPPTSPELERMITFRDVDADGELETILDYSPVKLHADPDASFGVNGKKKKSQNLEIAPPPTSESSSAKNQ